MSLLPSSLLRLAIGLVIIILLADAAGLPLKAVAVIAIFFTVFSVWLIVHKRRGAQGDPAKSSIFGATKAPLYTYGLLGFALASVLAMVGLMTTGANILTRLIEWNWEGFGLTSLEPLLPSGLVAGLSILSMILHLALRLKDQEEP
jgi:hypothetical protein